MIPIYTTFQINNQYIKQDIKLEPNHPTDPIIKLPIKHPWLFLYHYHCAFCISYQKKQYFINPPTTADCSDLRKNTMPITTGMRKTLDKNQVHMIIL